MSLGRQLHELATTRGRGRAVFAFERPAIGACRDRLSRAMGKGGKATHRWIDRALAYGLDIDVPHPIRSASRRSGLLYTSCYGLWSVYDGETREARPRAVFGRYTSEKNEMSDPT